MNNESRRLKGKSQFFKISLIELTPEDLSGILSAIMTFSSYKDIYGSFIRVGKMFYNIAYSKPFVKNVIFPRLKRFAAIEEENNNNIENNVDRNMSDEETEEPGEEANDETLDFEGLQKVFCGEAEDFVRHTLKNLFGGLKPSVFLRGGDDAVKSIELMRIEEAKSAAVNGTVFHRVRFSLKCILKSEYSEIKRDGCIYSSFYFQASLFSFNYSNIPRSSFTTQRKKLNLGDVLYFNVRKNKKYRDMLDFANFSGSFRGCYLFSSDGIKKLMGACSIDNYFDLLTFIRELKCKERINNLMDSAVSDLDLLRFGNDTEDVHVRKKLAKYIRFGVYLDSLIERVEIKTNMREIDIVEKVIDTGLYVVNKSNEIMRDFVDKHHDDTFYDVNSVAFLVSKQESGGKRAIRLENLEIESVKFGDEIDEFDEYAAENYPSRFNSNFIDSDSDFVLDFEVKNCFEKFPTLSKLISSFIRSSEKREKKLRVMGVISVIYSSFSQNHKYFAKYFHPLFISFQFTDPAFKLFNSLLGICYSKKSEKTIQQIAKDRFQKNMVLSENESVFLLQDNETITQFFANPIVQHNFTAGCYFKKTFDFNFQGYYNKLEITETEVSDLYPRKEFVELVIENAQEDILLYVEKKKSYFRDAIAELNKKAVEVIPLDPIKVETFSNLEISNSIDGVFEKNFIQVPNKNHFFCYISDLGYYMPASRILKCDVLKFVGYFHTQMPNNV